MGSVNKILVSVGRTLSLKNSDLTLPKHLGRNINPNTQAREKRNPTSYIIKGFIRINMVT